MSTAGRDEGEKEGGVGEEEKRRERSKGDIIESAAPKVLTCILGLRLFSIVTPISLGDRVKIVPGQNVLGHLGLGLRLSLGLGQGSDNRIRVLVKVWIITVLFGWGHSDRGHDLVPTWLCIIY